MKHVILKYENSRIRINSTLENNRKRNAHRSQKLAHAHAQRCHILALLKEKTPNGVTKQIMSLTYELSKYL